MAKPPTAKEAAKGNKTARARAAKDLGQKFFDEACNYLDTVELDGDATAWCRTCGSNCPLCPGREGGVVWVELAENTCTPWSAAGALLGWLDPASLASLAWGYWLRAGQPHHIINECTLRRPVVKFFTRILPGHRVVRIKASPHDLGFLCRRPRLYTIVSSDKLTVAIAPISEVFKVVAPERVVTDGGMFFCAPHLCWIQH